jgi:hypothetical protein
VNRPVDTAGTRAVALFQLRQPLFGVFQLFRKKKVGDEGVFNFTSR